MGKEGCLNGGKVSGLRNSQTADFITLQLKETGAVLPLNMYVIAVWHVIKDRSSSIFKEYIAPKLKIRVKDRMISFFTRVQKTFIIVIFIKLKKYSSFVY